MASPTKELTASDLISQATKISELVNGNWKNTVKTEISRKMEKQGDAAFVYLVSSLWLEQWKEMSGFDEISEGIEVNAGKLDLTKRLPKLNEDIVDDFLSKNIVRLGKFNPKLEFLDVVLKKGITEEIHFMYVTEEMWTCFKVWYSDAIEVKRKVYVNSHHEISYEVHCHLANFYFYTPNFIKHDIKESMKEPPKMIAQISNWMTYRELYDLVTAVLRKQEDFLALLKHHLPHTIDFNAFQMFFLKEGPDQAKGIEKALKTSKQGSDTLYLKNVLLLDKSREKISNTLRSSGIHFEGSVAFIVEVKRWDAYYFELEKEEEPSDQEDYFGTKKTNGMIETSKKDNRWGITTRKDSESSSTYQFREGISKMGVVGLKNLGNTCYMNSALQCLSNCKDLTKYFLDGDYKQDKNPDNVLGSKCKLVEAFAGLVNKMWYGDDDRVSPYDFKYEMGNFQSAFEGMNQHDSQELLSRLLDGLHEDLNLISKKPYIEDKDYTDKQDGPAVAREFWVNFLKRNYSKIIQLFYGQFKSEIKCPLCEVVSIKYDPFELVSLPVPQKYEVKDYYFSAYLIAQNHTKQAKKINFSTKYDNKHTPQISLIMEELGKTMAEGHKADRYLISFSGFSVHGDFISLTSGVDAVYQRNKDIDYKPKIFIFEKTDEEMAMEKKEGMVYVLAMSKLQDRDSIYSSPEYPSFSKMVWSNKNMTIEDLYYRIFLKFAHFVNVPKLKDQKISMNEEIFYPVAVTDYQELFDLCMNNEKFKFKFIFRIKWDGVFLDYDSKKKLSELIEEAGTVKKDFRGEIWEDNHSLLKLDIWLDPNAKLDNLVCYDFMKKINSDEIDVKVSAVQKDDDEGRKHNLYHLIQKFCEPEILDENNLYKCTNCKKQVKGLKALSIYKAPKYLIVHMKKLKYGYGFRMGGGSDHLMVDFPVKDFDLTPFVYDKNPIECYNIPKGEFMDKDNKKLVSRIIPEFVWNKDKLVYDCFGVINHYGSMNFGHYTAYAKNAGQWYCYDDSTVTKVMTPESVVTEAAYVLFYERRE